MLNYATDTIGETLDNIARTYAKEIPQPPPNWGLLGYATLSKSESNAYTQPTKFLLENASF